MHGGLGGLRELFAYVPKREIRNPSQVIVADATVSNDGIIVTITIIINDNSMDEDEEIFSLRIEEGANFPSGWEIEEVGNFLRITLPEHVTPRTVSFMDASSSLHGTEEREKTRDIRRIFFTL